MYGIQFGFLPVRQEYTLQQNTHSWMLLFLGKSVWDRERGRHTEQGPGDAIRRETAQVGIGGHRQLKLWSLVSFVGDILKWRQLRQA